MFDRDLNTTLKMGFFVVVVDKDKDSFFFFVIFVYIDRSQKYHLNLPQKGPCSVNVMMWTGLTVVFQIWFTNLCNLFLNIMFE